jgi:hypothetical protein
MFERLMVEDLVHWARDFKVNAAASLQQCWQCQPA